MSKPVARIDRISQAAVAAFAFMVERPAEWVPADRVAKATGASESTIYCRFGNLVAARAMLARRIGDFRHFRLHPDWQDSKLAAELHRRALDRGLLKAETAPD